jgi:hypothetical protein
LLLGQSPKQALKLRPPAEPKEGKEDGGEADFKTVRRK